MMKEKNNLLPQLKEAYRKDFNTSDDLPEVLSLLELTQAISDHIEYLLDKDFQSLLNIMYRLDIDEGQFKLAISSNTPAYHIAELVVEEAAQQNISKSKVLRLISLRVRWLHQ